MGSGIDFYPGILGMYWYETAMMALQVTECFRDMLTCR